MENLQTDQLESNQQQSTPHMLSLRGIIEQVSDWWHYILSKWKWIIPIALLLGTIGYFYGSGKKPTYTAEISFALDEQSNPQQKTAFTQLSESLGLQTNAADGGVFFSNMANIAELLKSRFLIEKTLMDTVKINAKTLRFANFFLDSLQLREKWIKNNDYYKTPWTKKDMSKEERLFQSNLLLSMCDHITTKNIKIDRKGTGSSIFSVKCTSENENFSKYFLESLMQNVTTYYTNIKTERAKKNLDFIQKRTDSIQNTFTSALYGRAAFNDAHMNPSRQVAVVSSEKQQTDIQILRTSYVELTKALELAKSELQKETPLFQYLDMPVLPLKNSQSNPMFYFMVFAIIGTLLSVFWFSLRRIYNTIMNNGTSDDTDEISYDYDYPDTISA